MKQSNDELEQVIATCLGDAKVHVFKQHSSYNTRESEKWSVMVESQALKEIIAAIQAQYISKAEVAEAIGENEDDKYWSNPNPGRDFDPKKVARNELRAELREKLGLDKEDV
jgi:hypothetical protein